MPRSSRYGRIGGLPGTIRRSCHAVQVAFTTAYQDAAQAYGQVGEERPALTRTPAAGQRQVQPAGLDRVRERSRDHPGDRGARRASGPVLRGR